MILLQRIVPFFTGLAAAAGFGLLMLSSPGLPPLIHPAIPVSASVLAVGLLIGRLSGWQVRSFQFWNLVGVPLTFIASGFGLFLFLEQPVERLTLGIVVSLFVFFFAEHVFTYMYLPAAYPAYAIEHLSLVLNVLSIFFAGAAGFGTRLFLQAPLYVLAPGFFLLALFIVYGTLWVSKVESRAAFPYAFAGALLMTELFSVVSFLPTGLYTDAAVLTLCLYLFLGVTRAHFLDKLSRTVVRRYLFTGAALVAAVFGTAQWK